MKNWFNRPLPSPKSKIPHGTFGYRPSYLSSIKIGKMIPNLAMEILPSDKVSLRSNMLVKLAPLKYPIFNNIRLAENYFFCPLRLILGNELYEEFICDSSGSKKLPEVRIIFGEAIYVEGDTIRDEIAMFTVGYNSLRDGIVDYLGYQISPVTSYVDASDNYYLPIGNGLKLFAHMLIWVNYYADEVLDKPLMDNFLSELDNYRLHVSLCWNNNTDASYKLFKSDADWLTRLPSISYTKDYFTSAATQPLRGDDIYLFNNPSIKVTPQTGTIQANKYLSLSESGDFGLTPEATKTSAKALITVNQQTSIRELWRLEQVARWLEVENIYGTRLVEKLFAHWGVVSSDARLQLPQFLGGHSQYFNVSEVLQTSASTDDSALGSYAGRATAFNSTRGMKRHFFEEHGILMAILTTVPDSVYCQGNEAYDFKRSNLDFAYPEFNNIGYQPIRCGELTLVGNNDPFQADERAWAFVPRYSEYRFIRSHAVGSFRYDPVVEGWAMSRNFSLLPEYNESFIHCDDNAVAKVFSSDDDYQGFAHVTHDIIASRPISYMPNPMHQL